ncbi:hypothetical protein LOC68_09120 [Blastopirellula sp. JC732]|uniref:Carboxypeptidase regulatory-like domain-containing protein n=1 Tax=Blastopirellula sediminis TaxID=2894196 RepID=A0A9X1SGD1_9BACT|nr:hypothetical protein [Blastopirellula sediminis]MCC9608667.1 hypothetical protein [Blastopirellula sediminis]MCC9628556.1 hypothetical protein [Blastopirellula sediminis]
MKYSTLATSLSAALMIALVGCGARGPEMGDVMGTVTYKGKPLGTGTITFVPETDGLPMGYAKIGADGTYEGYTDEFGKGVPIGKHRVMIMAVKDNGPEAAAMALIPFKYSSDRQSGLTAEVAAGENTVDFKLE